MIPREISCTRERGRDSSSEEMSKIPVHCTLVTIGSGLSRLLMGSEEGIDKRHCIAVVIHLRYIH
jgi:hypothetical protein